MENLENIVYIFKKKIVKEKKEFKEKTDPALLWSVQISEGIDCDQHFKNFPHCCCLHFKMLLILITWWAGKILIG